VDGQDTNPITLGPQGSLVDKVVKPCYN